MLEPQGSRRNTEEYVRRRPGTLLLFLLPMLHLSACTIMSVENLANVMMYVDFPISLLCLGLMWHHDHLTLWFAIFGTVWWFLISLVMRKLLRISMGYWD
jgi:hypothetical protein